MRRVFVFLLIVLLSASVGRAETKTFKHKRCVSPGAARLFLASTPGKSVGTASVSVPEGSNVVVLEADPDLLILSNLFDLKDRTVSFKPAIRNRYTYSVVPASFDGQASQTIQLNDDDSYELIFKSFTFPFGRKRFDRCFINSNGNITFEQADPDPPGTETLFAGPPRIAGLYADLDPESTGTIFVNQTSEKVTISWLKVPEFFNQNQFDYGQNTFQIALYHDGRIDLVFSKDLTATQGITGIIPIVNKGTVRMVDFTRGTAQKNPSFSFIESFRDYESVDIPRLMQSLYLHVKDRYDFVTLLSNFDLVPVPGAQAFAINVRNTTRGIGDPSELGTPIFRDNAQYGSRKTLENITFLGNLRQYPADPSQTITWAGTSLLGILAHEVGHRWLTYIQIISNGEKSRALLGRDQSHWSFFLDSEGSFLEGNQITQRSSNSFLTRAPFVGYSDLDLYLMGLIPASEVRDTFRVEGATKFSPSFEFIAESAPEPDVSFQGSAVPVRIEDIIAANGARRPSAASSQKSFNHLFVLITKTESQPTAEEIAYVENLRLQWEAFFSAITGGRATITTQLQQ